MLVARQNLLFVPFFLFATWLLLTRRTSFLPHGFRYEATPSILDEASLAGPASSTLGFGGIMVVSGKGSPRRSKLIQMANVTGLDLTIPDMPEWSDDDIRSFTQALAYDGRETGRGSKLSWLSHNYVLEAFLKSDLETALIIEDDVDWDIHLKNVQVPAAAAAARTLFEPATSYWGNNSAWDVMYLGHCGDWFSRLQAGIGEGHQYPENLTSRHHITFPDPSMPANDSLHPMTARFVTALRLPEHTRALHRSAFPLCTFGYAVTKASARRIVEVVAPITRPEHMAFDMMMTTGCKARGLKCYTLNPEIFHHMPGDSLIKIQENKTQAALPPVDAAGLNQTLERNESSNIGCGFWSGAFDFGDDQNRLEMLKEEVGRKGHCLKPGRTDIDLFSVENRMAEEMKLAVEDGELSASHVNVELARGSGPS